MLAAAIARHCPAPWSETAVPRQTLVAIDEPVVPTDMVYAPMLCFVADGAKRAMAGERSWVTGRGEMFLSSVHLPVTATFERVPYRSATLLLDIAAVTELLLELDRPASGEQVSGLTAAMPPELVDAVARWVRLLDDPADIRPLAAHVEAEILYRVLGTPLGPVLRQLVMVDSPLARVSEAAAWITAHYTEHLTIEAIAAVAHMSPATLHRHFKAATGMSPLQFQKHMRLQEARRRLVSGNATAALVADEVGYVSATQFNREYRRAYGLPPAKDAARLRGELSGIPHP